MTSLVALIESSPAAPSPPSTSSSRSPFPFRTAHRPTYLRKIIPPRCTGELALHSVTFAYPSPSTLPVLGDVSLFLPAHETTFIVGGSGSGKSTVAQLLLQLYEPQSGTIQLDDLDMGFLDDVFVRRHVAGVAASFLTGAFLRMLLWAVGRTTGRWRRREKRL
jgi:ATP-binding cassette, subfamily B (MDR/TAP), member 1